jgi:ribosome-binding protein aMBF1 (putative translation factor)
MSIEEELNDNFNELLGTFGSHANVNSRARRERRASMKVDDKRRKKGDARDTQLNVRVRESVSNLVRKICKDKSWSQADLIENAIEALAEALAKPKGPKPDA